LKSLWGKSDVLIFHDETDKAGEQRMRGHVLLFVPTKLRLFHSSPLFKDEGEKIELSPLEELFSKIEKLRKSFGTDHKFHFNEISGIKWTNG